MKKLKRKKRKTLLEITPGEKMLITFKSICLMGILNYFFYRSVWAAPALLLPGIMYFRMERETLLAQKRENAREQFKELMLLASTGQKAGYSAENAFLASYGDMELLYGRNSAVCKMLHALKVGRENHADFSGLWYKIGEKAEIAEIQEFAIVYGISSASSGNAAAVMEKTAGMIIQKIETEKEIEVMISARRLEQKIMNTMPFLIMLYINITSPGYFDGLYHSFEGAAVMTFCLSLYLAAYLISRKIAAIEV